MRRCHCCGVSEESIEINTYLITGKDSETNEVVTRKVNLCICCDAWGMTDKLKEIAMICEDEEEE